VLVIKKRARKWIVYSVLFIILLTGFLIVLAERYVEPLLKDKLHTFIIEGSDSLYTYSLGDLDATFFGGSVKLKNLQINVDSARFLQLKETYTLPSVTLELDLVKAELKNIKILALLLNKRISIGEIMSKDANIRVTRHYQKRDNRERKPLWKLLKPKINSIAIDRVDLNGVKLLYNNADTSESLKLQFDTCFGLFSHILIDSTTAEDKTRVGYAKEVSLNFRDLKFRSADSMSKLKAEVISYSSKDKLFEIVDFKMQPTLKDKEEYYKAIGIRKDMKVIEFTKLSFTNFQLDQFIHENVIEADSVFVFQPILSIYLDKTYPPESKSKIGNSPHQQLLKANSLIRIKGAAIKGAKFTYIEKGEKTKKEGTLSFANLNARISNITNDSLLIKQNHKCIANIKGNILGKGLIETNFTFYLDSLNGSFHVDGTIKNIQAADLNVLSKPLGNIELRSFNMPYLNFAVDGNDHQARGQIQMRYNNLFVVLLKTDKETGITKTNDFLTKILNKYTFQNENPGTNGVERTAKRAEQYRLTTQSFFGLIWRTVFGGMQTIMMNSKE
jgi:hypothetical protein